MTGDTRKPTEVECVMREYEWEEARFDTWSL